MTLIATVMAAPTKEDRMADATALLNYGFANFAPFSPDLSGTLTPLSVQMGKSETVSVLSKEAPPIVVPKEKIESIETVLHLPASVEAPVAVGQKLGTAEVRDDQNHSVHPAFNRRGNSRTPAFRRFIPLLSAGCADEKGIACFAMDWAYSKLPSKNTSNVHKKSHVCDCFFVRSMVT